MSLPEYHHRQRGLSLIEAMVGMVVGLLVALTAAGTAQVFNASQRQGMGVGSVGMNAATAMTAIRQDIGQAGLGFFGEGKYLCDTVNLSDGPAIVLNGADFTPVSATRPSGSLHDTLSLTFATHIAGGSTVMNVEQSNGDSIRLASLLPGAVGDAVLLSASTALPGEKRACTVRSITQVIPATPVSGMNLVFSPEGKHNTNVVSFTNMPNLREDSSVALLGALRMNSYSVDSDKNLVLKQELGGQTAILANNVVSFRVEYGVSADAAATSLSSWMSPAAFGTPTASNISKLRAIRVGLVTRSPQREKANKDGDCEASPVRPRLFNEEIIDPAISGSDWKCYRYRVATAVVPMRNVALGLPGTGLGITRIKAQP